MADVPDAGMNWQVLMSVLVWCKASSGAMLYDHLNSLDIVVDIRYYAMQRQFTVLVRYKARI